MQWLCVNLAASEENQTYKQILVVHGHYICHTEWNVMITGVVGSNERPVILYRDQQERHGTVIIFLLRKGTLKMALCNVCTIDK